MTSHRQPAIFAGHGSPMYAIEPNRYTAAWSALGKSLKRPDAILVISAHWVTRGTWVTAMSNPKTIHDFGGFPQALFEIQYPAPGSPALADRVQELLNIPVVLEENEWGIDHGAWSVLKYMYPDADVPVVQLSLDGSLTAGEHYELAKQLRPLRDENVLILSSGNVVHNLRTIHWQAESEPYPWAKKFNDFFASEMRANHHDPLIHWESYGDAAHLSVPTAEHYWPALYTLALQEEGEQVKVYTDGIEMSSISMLGFSIQ
ncbi:4,5-DOPA dioxygenase extradiol [Polynucleobacter sp. JS-Polo-80-F4]|uniref:4,5-DOPA-extradiol-dioxygenase n=1 Tax=Polynucleobacter sp. JS-Polo-80-F4 TaxID=2576918 RepID=UPI001C0CC606|nr:4,5-DOPA dioxygenase extradiol [Polynucleobacter sp. JS-Polo-80-F4]MBU3615938.1 4,5-DOPA dioxygenase extradiol [Polynucleobacter sp. JS-Polo-80-F4]